ncbi:MAG: uracil phosphoribosyltransferase [Candidatus Pacebacteria bacterium]|nr:uracil phosphoribosyltransferase [Candidatus Paceibacterota bacterium]
MTDQKKTSLKNIHVVNHPFVTDSLAHLRDKNTRRKKFRFHSDQICRLLFAEAIRGLEFKLEKIETPLTKMAVRKLQDEVVVVPVLRSGIAMLFGAMQLLPKSKIGFVGLERDEQTAVAHEYYWKLPELTEHSVVIVADPMLATGGSIKHVLDHISQEPNKQIRVVSVVSAPEGIEYLGRHYPKVEIFTAAIDDRLNRDKFIVPGLGDYGDRYFGTDGLD